MWTFDPLPMIIAGLVVGLVFGLLLQRAHVTRYNVILGQFLFKDFTVLKVMLTAIVTGGIGIYTMRQMGWIEGLHLKDAALMGSALGGLIFGIGMAVLGYCPGTGVGAIGDGSRHAIPGLLGMIVGAGLYAETFPAIKDSLLKTWTITVNDTSKITFVDLTALSPWLYLAGLAIVAAVVFVLIERWERSRGPRPAA